MPVPAFPALVDMVYPVHLPTPHASTVQPAERRLLSEVQGGPQQARSVQRDYLAEQQVEFVFTAAEADDFRAWFEDDLQQGGVWFAADAWPAPHRLLGGIARRFMAAPQWSFIAGGLWRVTARVQLRGVTRPPKVPGCIPWQALGAPPAAHLPALFGSGVWCVQDPESGYVWSVWRTGGAFTAPRTIEPSGLTLDGTFVLVYDPFTLALIDHIPLGASLTDQMNLLHIGGLIYVATEGNQYTTLEPVHKIDATTRAVLETGGTDNPSATVKWGHLSRDAGTLYLSIVSGVNDGTYTMQPDEPFGISLRQDNTNWVYCSVWNPFTNVRAYAGYGEWIDLQGAVTMQLDTSAYFDSATVAQSHRLVYKTCSPYIYAICCGRPGVLMVHTLTGEIIAFADDLLTAAVYYSPESDLLYVEGQTSLIAPMTVRVYHGTTHALVDELPDYAMAQGLARGNTVYIGDETFIGCESDSAPTSRMWRVSFPH